MDQRISKIRGVGAKVRGYLKAMHPEFSNKSTAAEFLAKYPNLEALVEAISAHDPMIKPRSMSSIRGSMRGAYELLDLLGQRQQGTKRRIEEASMQPEKKQKTAAEAVLPAALVRPVPNPPEGPIDPVIDSLASVKDTNEPFGLSEQPFTDQVQGTAEPNSDNTQQWTTNSLLEAKTEAMAIDIAEENPIAPTKELEFIPDHVETALVSTQEENYLEQRTANRLMHTTIIPAAALTNNDGAGVREAVRRSDRDMEVMEEEMDKQMDGEQLKGGGSKGAGRGRGPGKVTPPEEKMTIGQQLRGVLGEQAGQITRGVTSTVAKGLGIQLSGAGIGATLANAAINGAANFAKGAVGSWADGADIRNKMAREGIPEEKIRQVMQEMEETTGQTELESKGQSLKVDDLRPFLPVAGAMDVELAPGDIEQKKRNIKLFNNYKPPNWPLGNLDNKLYFQNLVLQGVHWESPLDSLPQVLPGGSLLDGTMEFTSDIYEPDSATLRDLAVEKQLEFKIPKEYGGNMMFRMHKSMAAQAREQITHGDTKYIHNPRALGVNAVLENGNYDMNPLDTHMHADLQVGGTEELRPLMPPCDAEALIQQPGQAGTQIPNEVYTSNPLFNPWGMYPKRF